VYTNSQFLQGKTFFRVCFEQTSHFQSEMSDLEAVADTISSSIKYCLEPNSLRHDSRLHPKPKLESTGNNLPSVLDAIFTGPDQSARIAMEEHLHSAVPTLAGISVPTNQQNNGEKTLEFVMSGIKPRDTISAELASDGALLLTAFLALAYGDTPGILLVEEPENGLHPARLKLVVDLLKKISIGEVGNRPRQVMVTTHSPVLLNYVMPEEVNIFHRTESGDTAITPMSKLPNIRSLLSDYGVGELWYLLGEEGLLREPA
jgi:predicted ATPase